MTYTEMAFFPANFMLQTHEDDHHHQPPTSLTPLLPPCTSQDFHGVASLLGKRSMSFSGIEVCDQLETNGGDDDVSDDGSQTGEKKRRLNMEQVKTLEKNFELGNKLEPERKMQLARALGLQPRQIAIWFQNRRARWKTKQLEKDYEVLKREFETIKADNDALQAHNQKLQAEILALKGREPTESINLNKETEGSCSNRSDNSSEVRLDISKRATPPPSIDSPNNNKNNNNSLPISKLFPPSMRPSGVAQLFQNSTSRPDLHNSHKFDQTPKDESFCNMFLGNIDDQSGLWPWLEHQHFN